MADPKILNRVRSLEAHFSVGLAEATRLRKELEGNDKPKKRGGLSEEDKARVRAHIKQTLVKNRN